LPPSGLKYEDALAELVATANSKGKVETNILSRVVMYSSILKSVDDYLLRGIVREKIIGGIQGAKFEDQINLQFVSFAPLCVLFCLI
jgi:hypothetical protein